MNLGPWIPIETNIMQKPEVLAIAKDAGRSVHETVGLLVGFWVWAAQHSEDGRMPVSIDDLHSIVGGSQAFWRSVARIGWLVPTEGGLEIPNADRWINGGAKARIAKNQRQARWRENRRGKGSEALVGAYTRLPNGDSGGASAPTEEALVGAYHRLPVDACRRLQASTREAPVGAYNRLHGVEDETRNHLEIPENPQKPTNGADGNVDAGRRLPTSTREEERREEPPPTPPLGGTAWGDEKLSRQKRQLAAGRLVEAFYAACGQRPARLEPDVDIVAKHLERHAEADVRRAIDGVIEHLRRSWTDCRTLRAAAGTLAAKLAAMGKLDHQRQIGFHAAEVAKDQLRQADAQARRASERRSAVRPRWDALTPAEREAIAASIPGRARLPEKLLLDACLDRLVGSTIAAGEIAR